MAVARRLLKTAVILFVLFLSFSAINPVTPTLTEETAPDSSQAPPLLPPYGPEPVGNYTGVGGMTYVQASYNKTMNNKTEETDTTDFTIEIAENWETYINITLEDITATSPVMLDIETNDTAVDGYFTFLQEPYMSFRVTNSCNLHSIRAYINRLSVRSGFDAYVWIYNATNSGGTPKPDEKQYLLPENVEFGSVGVGWISHTFSSLVFLDTSKTYDNTFFVTWENQGAAQSAWGLRDDTLSPPDNGYIWYGSPSVQYPNFDHMMNISLQPLGPYPIPSQINLQINGTVVNDSINNAGWWESTFIESNSPVFFDVSSTWPITFNYTYFTKFNQTFNGATVCFADSRFALVAWNITANIIFPDIGANANSRTLNFSVPEYWDGQLLYNGSTLIPNANYTDNANGGSSLGWIFIDEPHGAGDGSLWRVVSTDTNYVDTPIIWRGGLDVTGRKVNITDSLVVETNITIFTDGEGRFNPYDENGISLNEWNDFPDGNGLLSFPSFIPVSYGIGNVSMRCEVIWNNSYHVGIGLSSVNLVYPTTTSDVLGPYRSLIGDNVDIRVYYYDTYSFAGIENANVNVTFAGSTYLLVDIGFGFYEDTFDTSTLGLGRGTHLGLINASRSGYAPATTTITLTLSSKTQLFANWTTHTMNYTENVLLEVNYSVLTPAGEGGITGALVNITAPGFFSWLSEEGGGNYSILLDGMVLGVGTHNLLVNASKPGLFYQENTLLVTLIVEGEPTKHSGSSPPSVDGGSAFNVSMTYETQTDTGIVGASFTCLLNDTPFTQFIVYDLANGSYRLQFTLNVSWSSATFNITITASRDGYNPQTYKALVNVLIQPSTVSVEVLSVLPVVYDGDFIIRVTYSDLSFQGLIGAVVQGNWSIINSTDNLDGTYTVQCSTTGSTVGLWTINFSISVDNYEGHFFIESFRLVWSTSLTPFNGDYSPREYENESLIFDVVFNNTNNGLGIDAATVWAIFQSNSSNLVSMGGGLYRLTIDLTDVNPGTYSIVIFAQRTDYQNQSLNLSLEVLSKISANLNLDLTPVPLYEGQQVTIIVVLTHINGTPITDADVVVNVWIHYANGTNEALITDTITTDILGRQLLFVQLNLFPPDFWGNGESPPELCIEAIYHGSREIASISLNISELILPTSMPWWLALLLFLLPFIILIVFITIIGWTVYAKRIKPRKIRKQIALEESGGMWAQRMMGLMDLRVLFVMYSSTGLPIFTYSFTGSELPSTLLSGFISAVNAFYSELSGVVDRESQLRDIDYKDLHLSLREGKRILSVLILDASPSEEITDSLAKFTTGFENAFTSELEGFDGRIDLFDSATQIVEKSFHGELLVAYECIEKPPRGFSRKIFDIAVKLADDKGRVYLPQLFVSAIEKYGVNKKFDIANALEQLCKSGCLGPHRGVVNAESFPSIEDEGTPT